MNSHTNHHEAELQTHLGKAVLEVLLAQADTEGKGKFIRKSEVF